MMSEPAARMKIRHWKDEMAKYRPLVANHWPDTREFSRAMRKYRYAIMRVRYFEDIVLDYGGCLD